MKNCLQCFALLLAFFACTNAFAQGAGKVSTHDISFNADDMSHWDVKPLPEKAKEGRHVLATAKSDKSQVIAVLRDGKIAQIGFKRAGGTFKALTPSAAGCSSTGLCLSFQIRHCFELPGGGCACVCGAWITSYPNN